MFCNHGYTLLLSLFPCHCWSFKGDRAEAAVHVHINKPGTNQRGSTSLLGRLLQKRNVSLQTVQMLSSAWERDGQFGDRPTLTGMEEQKRAEWGEKKTKNERWDQRVSIDAVKRSSQLCGGRRPAALQLHCHFRQRHGEAGLLRPVQRWMGTNLLLN